MGEARRKTQGVSAPRVPNNMKMYGDHIADYRANARMFLAGEFSVHNDGKEIVSCNYYQSKMNDAGMFFLSWNDGAARLLMYSDCSASIINEFLTAKEMIIKPFSHNGKKYLYFIFEDYSGAPFTIWTSFNAMDRNIPFKANFTFDFFLYTDGLKKRLQIPGSFRANGYERFDGEIRYIIQTQLYGVG